MTTLIRPATSDADLGELGALVNAVTPDDPASLEEMRWADATYPGNARFLATADGRVVGAATVGRIYFYPPEHLDLWASIVVVPDARRHGVGSALLRTVSVHAASAGKSGLQGRAWEHRPEGIAFLVHRGFHELERSRMVSLDLSGHSPTDRTSSLGSMPWRWRRSRTSRAATRRWRPAT
ncbi:MAG: GNAT family N-acetyltransferase [Chloroflexota bacterium]